MTRMFSQWPQATSWGCPGDQQCDSARADSGVGDFLHDVPQLPCRGPFLFVFRGLRELQSIAKRSLPYALRALPFRGLRCKADGRIGRHLVLKSYRAGSRQLCMLVAVKGDRDSSMHYKYIVDKAN